MPIGEQDCCFIEERILQAQSHCSHLELLCSENRVRLLECDLYETQLRIVALSEKIEELKFEQLLRDNENEEF